MQTSIAALIKPFVCDTGGLLKALHAVQNTYGYIDAVAVPVIADVFNLSKAEIKGVISFYEDFRRSPAGHHVIKICQAEACQAVGARDLTEKIRSALGFGGPFSGCDTSVTGRITLEPVYCLGLCASGPAAMLDGVPRGRLNSEDFTREIKALENGAEG